MASASALKVGRSITVTGTKESNGTIAAKTIVVGTRPTGRGKPPSHRGGQPPSGAAPPGATTSR